MLTKFEISNILTKNFSGDPFITGIGVGINVFVYVIDIGASFEISRKLDLLFPDTEDREQVKIQIIGKIKPL